MDDKSLRRTQLGYLTRHFFGRFFDSELVSTPHADMHLLFVQMLAISVFPGLLRTFLSVTKYSALAWLPIVHRDRAVLIDGHFFLCLSMVMTGFITVFEWEALFPDQKDFHNLSPLPIEPRILFFAKVMALSLFILLFGTAINGLSSLIFPGAVLVWSCTPGTAGTTLKISDNPMYHLGHALSLFLSCIFIFTSLISVRAVLLLITPGRFVRVVSRSAQLILILILLCSLLTFPGIMADDLVKAGNPVIYLLPQFWFLGIYQVLIGHHALVYFKLSKMGFAAVTVSTLLSIISYTISYRASMQKGFQSAGIASYSVSIPRKIWNRLLHRIFLRRPLERASYHFAAQTVFRRQEHMLYLGSFVAVAIALICLGFFLIKTGYVLPPSQHFNVLLSFPLIFSFFMLVGLRFTFSIPADLSANWVFKIIEKNQQEAAYGGAHKFLLCAFYIPLLLIFVPCYLTIWEPRLVALHIIYVSMLSLILMELLLFNFNKLPFTCSYLPGKSNIKLFWPAYVLACALYSYGTTVLERWMMRDLKCYLAFLLIAGISFIQLKKYRSRQLRILDQIQFEETLPDQRTILTIET